MWNIAVETSTWNPHDNQKSERLAQFNTQIPNQRIKVQRRNRKELGENLQTNICIIKYLTMINELGSCPETSFSSYTFFTTLIKEL